jgi:PPM family protein phosphatase
MDHSLLQELVDRGFYSPEEAQRAANKNYVTRALGVEPNVDVEVQEHPVRRVTCISFARTACRTWSRTTTFT